jgi:uncharacterized coiled-coil DUF342 family protein
MQVTADRDKAKDELNHVKEVLEALNTEANAMRRELEVHRVHASPTFQTIVELTAECDELREHLEQALLKLETGHELRLDLDVAQLQL